MQRMLLMATTNDCQDWPMIPAVHAIGPRHAHDSQGGWDNIAGRTRKL